MTARELVDKCRSTPSYQRWVNAFIDEFRSANAATRDAMIVEAPAGEDEFAGLAAATIDALCREVDQPIPEWIKWTRSPKPFFAFPAQGYALRVRLMLESPPAFRSRNVFVPATYLSRA